MSNTDLQKAEQRAALAEALQTVWAAHPARLVFSAPRLPKGPRRATLTRLGEGWQLECLRGAQAFHENLEDAAALQRACSLLQQDFSQALAFAPTGDFGLRVTKKGKILTNRAAPTLPREAATQTHNRQKQYLLPEGQVIAPLVDMGVFTPSGQIVKAKYDKYRQINRFVELVDDALQAAPPTHLRVVDFGCGKSYLTFILYHFLREVRGIEVEMTGLDLKADVVEKCNTAAQKYGYTGLRFQVGDIAGFTSGQGANMVITLHACDTATDLALAKAVEWGADMIFSVPCCQHELNSQMHSEPFALLTRYGIVQERTAALLTDAIRAALLEASGYRTQILEFVDFAHTPKNLLIRAKKANLSPAKKQQALAEAKSLIDAFHLEPTLLKLLKL